jgi:response regulator RpfG family c-di-GMP phosphodiesterase
MSQTVLIVEDNPIMRRMLRLTLATAGYDVLEAVDGRSAIALVDECPADVVVQDLVLPDMGGMELLASLRAMRNGSELPVIALSGLAQRLDEAISVNFNEFLVKPVEPSRLLEALRRVLPLLEPPASHRGQLILVVDDDQVQGKLLGLRLEELGYNVEAVGDGTAALNWARENLPDAVISDVLMPGIDGFKVCKTLRDDPRFAGVPVLLTSSAYVEPADRELARAVGANGLIVRTPQLNDLLNELDRALDGPSAATSVASDQVVERKHAERMIRQVERQAAINAQLGEQYAARSLELSMLSALSRVLTRDMDVERLLDEVLARLTEVVGTSLGAAYVVDADGELKLSGHVGFEDRAALEDFFGEPQLLAATMRAAATLRIPSAAVPAAQGAAVLHRAGARSLLVEPLPGESDAPGVLVVGTQLTSLSKDQVKFVTTVASQTSQGLALARTMHQLARSQQQTIERLARAAEFHDHDTAQHTQRVGHYANLIAERLDLPPEHCELIKLASMMHDVGKIGISDKILLKPGPLTKDERAEMERHAEHGYRILASDDDALLQLAATIARTHHERYDGRGYPNRLSGAEIPLEGRITAVADVFDALTSDRVYRVAMSVERAVDILSSERGAQFDTRLVDAFLDALPEVLEIRQRFADPPLPVGLAEIAVTTSPLRS